jgi:hypothetical protein
MKRIKKHFFNLPVSLLTVQEHLEVLCILWNFWIILLTSPVHGTPN